MGTEIGIRSGHLTKKNDVQHRTVRHYLILPKMGRNLFSPLVTSPLGAFTIIEEGNHHPRCKKSTTDFTVPLQQLPEDIDLCFFDVALAAEENVLESLDEPEKTLAGVIMKATVGVDKWHRRLEHGNLQSMGKLRKTNDNSTLEGCEIFAVMKSQQKAHLKTAKMNQATAPMMLVCTDLIGLISLNAMGKFCFVSRFTDQYTRWHEYLPHGGQDLHRFDIGAVQQGCDGPIDTS